MSERVAAGTSGFAVTFLGHQGWLIRAGRTAILVDPLLREEFGEIHALDYRVYPPRILRTNALPPIDAVVLSHEHDDHFDIASLAHLDRRIPVHLSAHSSVAAFGILREMGFDARPLVPGVRLEIGDLEVIPLSGDHVNVNCADEWDSLPYLVRDKAGDGSFFSMVDVVLLKSHVEWAKALVRRPGLVTWSNNALDWSHMGDEPARDVGTDQCLRTMSAEHRLIASTWGAPSATLICAGGFSFQGEQTWLNQRVFWVDCDAVCRHLASFHKGEKFYSTLPGQTFRMEANRLVDVEQATPFLELAPRAQWPVRVRAPLAQIPDYAPALGTRDLAEADVVELSQRLVDLARAFVGGILFRSLHSMLAVETAGRKPTFALLLRLGPHDARLVYEYDASACAFAAASVADPRNTYLAGFECWASDLLAVLRGEIGPIALMFGRSRIWNALPQRFHFDMLEGLTRVTHPLCRPAEFLRNYRRLRDRHSSIVPGIGARTQGADMPTTLAVSR